MHLPLIYIECINIHISLYIIQLIELRWTKLTFFGFFRVLGCIIKLYILDAAQLEYPIHIQAS